MQGYPVVRGFCNRVVSQNTTPKHFSQGTWTWSPQKSSAHDGPNVTEKLRSLIGYSCRMAAGSEALYTPAQCAQERSRMDGSVPTLGPHDAPLSCFIDRPHQINPAIRRLQQPALKALHCRCSAGPWGNVCPARAWRATFVSSILSRAPSLSSPREVGQVDRTRPQTFPARHLA